LLLLALATLVVSLGVASNAGAQLTPPWCGTPVPDAAGSLPDGSQPTHPAGSFPHIPYYAIGCTLDEIEGDQLGNRMTVEVIGQSALGRDLYGVVFNALDTPQQQRDYDRWVQWRGIALEDPARAQALLDRWGGDIKVPVYVQGGIHGNEYEGVESNMQLIEELATTPYGVNPKFDDILDHVILVFNVIQNPDGRVAGTRANGNGFDLNRDFLTQSQSETVASVTLMQEWLPVEVLDLHGYVTPTLIEATTKPHNPSIEYDLWLKWNQDRIDFNQAAMADSGFNITRPINDWCADGSDPDPPGAGGVCEDGTLPGPAVAESWDDWGPFYTPMYAQHVGLDGSTVEMCNQTDGDCGIPGDSIAETPGRLGSYEMQYIVTTSSLEYVVANRSEMLYDEAERYRRGVEGEPRVACCPPPFDIDNNWMKEFPTAYVIPLGAGQRSDAEANRLVDWLLRNGIEVSELKQDASFGGQTFERGSYVVWMNQAHRGLADTALFVGTDVTDRIGVLYAPPAAWSHGYLWGADIAEITDGAAFNPISNRIKKPSRLDGGLERGGADAYALELDSPTAVRLLNRVVGEGLTGELALEPFPAQSGDTLPAGSVLFAADPATKGVLGAAGRENGILFRRVAEGAIPDTDPIDRVPRILALTGGVNQDVWSLRDLDFPVDFMSTAALNASPTDPLVNYDVIWNTGGWPSAANGIARARLLGFFASGGGYIGSGTGGANFLTAGGQVAGLTVGIRTGQRGASGIVRWLNQGGVTSLITGSYPSEDTAIVDPPSWFTAVPGSYSVDARLPLTDFFLAGLWFFDAVSATAPGAPFVAHGTNTAGTARLTSFAMNPLYRADPEREWPMVGAAAYWADQ
jgi:hypothetical protein